MHYSCLLALVLAAVALARPHPDGPEALYRQTKVPGGRARGNGRRSFLPMDFATKPNGRFGSDSLDGDYPKSGDYSKPRGTEGYGAPTDGIRLHSSPDYSASRYPSEQSGDRLAGVDDSFAQDGRGMPTTGVQGLGDDERKTGSYPSTRDSLPTDHDNYKRDGGSSFMGLDSLMSLGDSFAQKGKSALGGFPGLADDERTESYPRSRDSFSMDHDNYKRDGGNSIMGLGDSLMSLGDSVAQKGRSALGGFPGLTDDERSESYPRSRDSFPMDHDNYKRDGGNSFMGLDSLMSLGDSFAQNGKSALGGFPGLADDEKTESYPSSRSSSMGRDYNKRDGGDSITGLGDSLMNLGQSLAQNARDSLGSGRLTDGQETEDYPSQKDSYMGPTYQKRDFLFGGMGEDKMGLDGIKGLSGLGGNLMGSGDSRRPNRLGAEMGGPHAAQGGDPEDDRMTGSERRGGRLGNGIAKSDNDSYGGADPESPGTTGR